MLYVHGAQLYPPAQHARPVPTTIDGTAAQHLGRGTSSERGNSEKVARDKDDDAMQCKMRASSSAWPRLVPTLALLPLLRVAVSLATLIAAEGTLENSPSKS